MPSLSTGADKFFTIFLFKVRQARVTDVFETNEKKNKTTSVYWLSQVLHHV